jgi:COP9 signalosome complex subunit 7
VVTFGELLGLPNVLALADDPGLAPTYRLLELFAYGTWGDYRRAPPGQLPELSPALQRKLKQLTLMSLARGKRTLEYRDLMQALEVGSVLELEDILISLGLYAGVIRGTLDQRRGRLEVEAAGARDLHPEDLGEQVLAPLDRWLETSGSLIRTLEAQEEGLVRRAQEAREIRKNVAAQAEILTKTAQANHRDLEMEDRPLGLQLKRKLGR